MWLFRVIVCCDQGSLTCLVTQEHAQSPWDYPRSCIWRCPGRAIGEFLVEHIHLVSSVIYVTSAPQSIWKLWICLNIYRKDIGDSLVLFPELRHGRIDWVATSLCAGCPSIFPLFPGALVDSWWPLLELQDLLLAWEGYVLLVGCHLCDLAVKKKQSGTIVLQAGLFPLFMSPVFFFCLFCFYSNKLSKVNQGGIRIFFFSAVSSRRN